jgi:hypothetical protein
MVYGTAAVSTRESLAKEGYEKERVGGGGETWVNAIA